MSEDKLKVVAIDNSLEYLRCLCKVLEESGCETFCFDSPEQAIVFLLANEVDVLVMSIHMPNLDGKDLCSIIRAHEELKSLPIVLISGDSSIGDFTLYFKGVDFMQKPVDPTQLLAKIKMYHKLKSMEDTLSNLLERRSKK